MGYRQNHSKLKNLTNYENFYLDNNNIISYIIKMDGKEERKVKKKIKLKISRDLLTKRGKYAHKKIRIFYQNFFLFRSFSMQCDGRARILQMLKFKI